MRLELKSDGGKGLKQYLSAMTAYRLTMIEVFKDLSDEYGDDSIRQYFHVENPAELIDASSSHYLRRSRIKDFLKNIDPINSAKRIIQIDKKFQSNPVILNFKNYLDRIGKTDISNDLIFFMEHRIKYNRIVLKYPHASSDEIGKFAELDASRESREYA